MKKFNHKNFLSIFFVAFIFITGIATIALNPGKIFGGLVRGYMNSDGDVLNKIGNGFSALEDRENEYYVLHDQCINTYGEVQKLIGSQLIFDAESSNTVLKLNNNYLTFMQNRKTDTEKLGSYLISLKSKHKDIDFLFVNKASKDTDNLELLPEFYPYINKTNIDKTMKTLQSNGINVLDVNSVIEQQNINKYSLFFKTDHHWTPKTGIWVSQLISESLNNNFEYNTNLELFNIENYNIETHKDSFLGSQGKRVGKYYGGTDDFDIILPKYNTDLTVKAVDVGFNVTGDFEDTLIHRENLTPDNLLNKDTTAYDVYMAGNHDLVTIENHNNKNGKKALLVLDSYGVVVAPFLSQSFSKLDCIDIRSYTKSVDDYITNNSPDVVIYMISTAQE